MDPKKDKKQKQSANGGEVKRLKEELEMSKKQYLRALADYHNLERRMSDINEETVRQATKRLVLRLLPFVDNLEKAEVFIKDPGLGMIKNQFYKTLQDEGLTEIQILGKPFDPHHAEAVEVVQGDTDNMVAEVVQKGYMLGDKVIRPAQVKVSKKS